MTDVSHRSDLHRAEHAAALAQADPARARRLAREVIDLPSLAADAHATALWAWGLAARELDALDEAHQRFAEAVAVADGAGLTARGARIRLSWSLVLVYRGDTDAALAVMDQARPHLLDGEAGHCDVQHALVMTRLGRFDEALEDARRALPLLRVAGDRIAEARLLSNLGVLRVYRGEFREATAELDRARALADELGQTLLLARTIHNQAFVHGRQGDVPRSLCLFDDAEASYRRLDDPDPYLAVLDADRAEVLLAAGLAQEARARAEASLTSLVRAENLTDRAEVSLLVARCRSAAGDCVGATEAAQAAAGLFSSQSRPAWRALADFVAVQATDLEAPGLDVRAREAANQLGRAGWRIEEHNARLLAAKSLLAAGENGRAIPLLEAVAARRRRRTGAERTAAWHATALLRLARADRGGARRAVAAGLRVIEDHRATLGASELRAHASAAGVDLARIGLRLAVGDRRPREALRWIEALRAVSILTPPARPPDDIELAEDLARLRVAEAARWTTTDPAGAAASAARVRALETTIVRRTRRVAGAARAERFDIDGLVASLGDRLLLEYAVLDGELLGLAIRGGRMSLHHLGPVGPVEREATSAIFSLRRMARGGASAGSLAGAGMALDHALGTLDRLVAAPFRRLLGDRSVVVVPAAGIRRVPFGSLATFAEHPVSVAPSAATWTRASSVPAPDGQVVLLAAGPGLDGADGEIDELSVLYPSAVVLRPPASTVDAVLGGLAGGVGIAHVAAHGTFRADNAQFSSLTLSDGPLTVHDLALTPRCPAWFVLSACDAAVNASPGGDEMLGFGAGLLSLGAANLVAPLMPVSDEASRPLMVALHRRLLAGDAPAAALAAVTYPPAADPAARSAQVGFSVLGS